MLGQVFVFAQSSSRTMNAWDSLRLRTTEEIKLFEDIARVKRVHIDTLEMKGSTAIAYFDSNKQMLKKITNLFNLENCLVAIESEYYNSKGLLAFRQDYKKCCPGETTEDYKCFEKTIFYERFEYDDKNRMIIHVYHVTTPGTYKETFTYALDGSHKIQRATIEETKFWE